MNLEQISNVENKQDLYVVGLCFCSKREAKFLNGLLHFAGRTTMVQVRTQFGDL